MDYLRNLNFFSFHMHYLDGLFHGFPPLVGLPPPPLVGLCGLPGLPGLLFRLVGLILVGRVPLVTGEEVVVEDLGVVEESGAGLVKVGRGPNLGNWGRRSEKPPEKWDDVCLFASFVFLT